MNLESLRGRLRQLHFAADLPAFALDQVAKIGHVLQCHAGETLFREGDLGRTFYVVVAGQLTLSMEVEGHGDVPMLILGPGDPVAWSALIGSGRMTTSAMATTDVRLIAIPADELDELCRSDPEFGSHWMRAVAVALSRRLLATRFQLLELIAGGDAEAATLRQSLGAMAPVLSAAN